MCCFVLSCACNGTSLLYRRDFWLEICFLILAFSESCQKEIEGVEWAEELIGMAKDMSPQTTALSLMRLPSILPCQIPAFREIRRRVIV